MPSLHWTTYPVPLSKLSMHLWVVQKSGEGLYGPSGGTQLSGFAGVTHPGGPLGTTVGTLVADGGAVTVTVVVTGTVVVSVRTTVRACFVPARVSVVIVVETTVTGVVELEPASTPAPPPIASVKDHGNSPHAITGIPHPESGLRAPVGWR